MSYVLFPSFFIYPKTKTPREYSAANAAPTSNILLVSSENSRILGTAKKTQNVNSIARIAEIVNHFILAPAPALPQMFPSKEWRKYFVGDEGADRIAEPTIEAVRWNQTFTVIIGIKERLLNHFYPARSIFSGVK